MKKHLVIRGTPEKPIYLDIAHLSSKATAMKLAEKWAYELGQDYYVAELVPVVSFQRGPLVKKVHT